MRPSGFMAFINSKTPVAQVYWRRDAGALASSSASASCQCRLENIWILAVVMPPRKFVQIQRQILLADVVLSADDSTLEQRPEGIKVRGVDFAAYILASAMVHALMRITDGAQIMVALVLIGRYQVNLVAHNLVDETIERLGVRVFR